MNATTPSAPLPSSRTPRTHARARIHTRLSAAAAILAASAGTLAQVVTTPAGGTLPAPTPVPAPAPATEPIVIPGPNVIIPQVRWRHRPVAYRQVELTAVDATVTIDAQLATTLIELTLTNTSTTPQEAQIVLPVADGATVRALQYDGTGPEPTAKILPKDAARAEYNAIVSRLRDPALLEFAGYNLIKTSVFPVPPGATQKVRITYEQLLTADGARVDYLLPRSESPTPGGTPWTLRATIKSPAPISAVYSASHDIATERTGPGEVSVKVPAAAAANPGPFRLSYLGRAADGLDATFFTFPDASIGEGTPGAGKGGYFLMLAGLPPTPANANRALKREVTLVLDRSGSMGGNKIAQAIKAAQQVVGGLSDGESFNIIDYSDNINAYAPAPVVKNAATAKAALDYLSTITANGGTNLHGAILESLRAQPTPGTLPMVLFLTDGLPTVGERSESRIRDDVKAANSFARRLFTFGVGFDVNTPLLSALARSSRASATYVLPDEDVEVKVGQVFRRLSGPVLASPKLTFLDAASNPTTRAAREIVPSEVPDLFEGEQLVILGQYTGAEPVKVRLDGNFLGAERTFDFTFDPARSASPNHGFVARLWASRKIGALVDAIRQSGADPNHTTADPRTNPKTKELVDEIVRLSTRFGILTEYTSFLATAPGEASNTPAVRFSEATAAAGKQLALRNEVRAGAAAMNQEANVQQQMEQTCLNAGNRWFGANMAETNLVGCQQLADQTLFYRNNRWVDARAMAHEEQPADLTVEFGTKAFDDLLDQLIKENRQALIANSGETLVVVNNQRVLVRCP